MSCLTRKEVLVYVTRLALRLIRYPRKTGQDVGQASLFVLSIVHEPSKERQFWLARLNKMIQYAGAIYQGIKRCISMSIFRDVKANVLM